MGMESKSTKLRMSWPHRVKTDQDGKTLVLLSGELGEGTIFASFM